MRAFETFFFYFRSFLHVCGGGYAAFLQHILDKWEIWEFSYSDLADPKPVANTDGAISARLSNS